jgi:uncharacterized membrane protein
MFLVIIIVVAAIVVAVVFLMRGISMGGQTRQIPPTSTPEGPSPKNILKRGYATGDIDREEFQQRLRDLES